MAIRYKVEQAKIGFGTEKKEAYVGKIQLGMTVETEMLVEQVSLRTGMTQAQVKMTLDNMTESILHFCKLVDILPSLKERDSGVIGSSLRCRSYATSPQSRCPDS